MNTAPDTIALCNAIITEVENRAASLRELAAAHERFELAEHRAAQPTRNSERLCEVICEAVEARARFREIWARFTSSQPDGALLGLC